ncbi:MAG TPA: energy transducer TonB [bacterium]
MKTQNMVVGMPPYGAAELKGVLQKYLTFAVILAAGVHLSLVGIYRGITSIDSMLHPSKMPFEKIIKIYGPMELPPPPPLGSYKDILPVIPLTGTVTKPDFGNPVPVPDAQADPGMVFATQGEVNRIDATELEKTIGDGDVLVLMPQDDDNVPPERCAIFEKEPILVKKIDPVYPEIAKKTGLTGKVVVNLWVDKKGRVREVRIVQSTSEMFNQAVIDAASQFVFTPAMMNKGPVSVWVAMPFVFELR